MKIELHLGDCLDVLPEIPDASIDLVVADLPYGLTRNKWDSVIPLDRLWDEYLRVCKGNAAIVLTASQPFASVLVMSMLELFRHEWIWIKNRGSNFANTVREPMKEHESVLVFSRGKWTYNKQMQERSGGGLSRVKYDFRTVTETPNFGKFDTPPKAQGHLRVPSSWQKFNTEVGLHPTQKPVVLMEYLVRTYSNENDTILDNAMGSGTTGVACILNSRNFIGIEKCRDYFSVAEKRLRGCAPQLPSNSEEAMCMGE